MSSNRGGPADLYASTPHYTLSKQSLYGSEPHNTDALWSQARHHISQPALHRSAERSFPSLPRGFSEVEALAYDQRRLLDAQTLRRHQRHLESRSKLLEEQNRQLKRQLDRLQKMVPKVCQGREEPRAELRLFSLCATKRLQQQMKKRCWTMRRPLV